MPPAALAPSPELIDRLLADKQARLHFVGISGVGMIAYADFHALMGGTVSGSDRTFDQGKMLDRRADLIARGMQIFPQDGSGVTGAAAIIVSAAIEPHVADYAAAMAAGVPIITRPAWLAAHYRAYRCLAITGTSGKSTVTAMLYTILKGAGLDPALLTGADLIELVSAGQPGSAAAGRGPLVIEADESDKGIADYHPAVGLIHNLQRDHDEPEVMIKAFAAFKANCDICLLSDDPALTPLRTGARIYGSAPDSDYRISDVVLDIDRSQFRFQGEFVAVPLPGQHNVDNAAAALAAGVSVGGDLKKMIAALSHYRGVARRFEVIANVDGIEVIDDYAHNPPKIASVLRTAARRGKRTKLWFQPMGFGPTRFMRKDLVDMLTTELRPQDEMYFAPIYYVGGTVARDISSDDLVADLVARGRVAKVIETREGFIELMKETAAPGDVIALTGGRDPSLSGFSRALAAALRR